MMYLPSIFGDDLFDSWIGFGNDFGFRPERRSLPSKKNESAERPFSPSRSSAFMKTDIKETETGYDLDVELPGYKKDDIKLTLDNGYLSISASKNDVKEKKDEEGKIIHRERFCGNVARSFYVGDALTEEDIKAKFEDGILKLSIPKKETAVPEKKYISIEG